MADLPVFLSCDRFARATGYHRQTINAFCLRFPGFGFQAERPGGWWRIPREHAFRLMNGESIASIAANPSVPRLNSIPSKTAKWLSEEATDAPPS